MNVTRDKARYEFHWAMLGVAMETAILIRPPHVFGVDAIFATVLVYFVFRARYWFREWVKIEDAIAAQGGRT